MKLLNCFDCNDILLLTNITRKCGCGSSKGRYRNDDLNAIICGNSRVIGMIN